MYCKNCWIEEEKNHKCPSENLKTHLEEYVKDIFDTYCEEGLNFDPLYIADRLVFLIAKRVEQ
jgi:hypothetical protein